MLFPGKHKGQSTLFSLITGPMFGAKLRQPEMLIQFMELRKREQAAAAKSGNGEAEIAEKKASRKGKKKTE